MLLTVYYAGDQVKMTEMGRACSTSGGSSAYRGVVGKPEGSRPLEGSRRRWKDNIKMDLTQVGWGRGLDASGFG